MIPMEEIEKLIKEFVEDFVISFETSRFGAPIDIGLTTTYKTHEWIDDCVVKFTLENDDETKIVVVIDLRECKSITITEKTSEKIKKTKEMIERMYGMREVEGGGEGGYGGYG